MSRRPTPATPTGRHTTPVQAAPAVRTLRADEPAEGSSTPRPDAPNTDRMPPAPVPAVSTRRAGRRLHGRVRGVVGRWLPRRTNGRALALLAVSVLVLLGGTLAVAHSVTHAVTHAVTAGTQPPPSPALSSAPPLPPPTVEGCPPGSPLPVCHLPTPTSTPLPTPTGGLPLPIPTGPSTPVTCLPGSLQPECLHPSASAPATATPTGGPCTGVGCIPQPVTSVPAPSAPGAGSSGGSGGGGGDCGITDLTGCITEAVNGFFQAIVTAALNPLLDLLSRTLLATPTPGSLPRLGELWNTSWQILLLAYGLLILIGGILVMGYETLQTRYSVKQIAPRIVVGFLAGALSLWVATQAIQIANALAAALMGGGVQTAAASETLKNLVLGAVNGGIFATWIGLLLAGMLICLLVTYIVRVALTVILIAGAPLALMAHALPQTEGVARWWWKAFGGCLAIQVGQSLTLITAMRVFLAPGGFTLFGPTADGVVNLLFALAIMYVLFKIPFWFLAPLRGHGGRSLLGSIVRGFLAYKTLGLLGARGGRGGRTPRAPGGGRGGNGGGSADPYARTRTTASGQYLLPLTGVRRSRPAPKPKPAPVSTPRPRPGRQLALPLGGDWPEWKQHGRDGQYRLPLDVQRVKPTPPRPGRGRPGGRRRGRPRGGTQPELPFDPYKGNRPNRSGQYPLPMDGIRRTGRPASPPLPASPTPPRTRGTQPELPFDPYKGNRATRSGQYPLPLEGMQRAAPATPPPPTPTPATPAPATRPASRPGRQLRLPLDLPTPTRRTPPAPPSAPPTSGGKS